MQNNPLMQSYTVSLYLSSYHLSINEIHIQESLASSLDSLVSEASSKTRI